MKCFTDAKSVISCIEEMKENHVNINLVKFQINSFANETFLNFYSCFAAKRKID